MRTVTRTWSIVHSDFYRRRYGLLAPSPLQIVAGQPSRPTAGILRLGGAKAAR